MANLKGMKVVLLQKCFQIAWLKYLVNNLLRIVVDKTTFILYLFLLYHIYFLSQLFED